MEKGIQSISTEAVEREKIISPEQIAIKRYREIFTSILAHDIKTPIIAQIRSLELLLSGVFDSLSPKQAEIISQTLESSRYVYSMIKNTLSAYNVENDNKTKNEYFDFKELTKDTCIKLVHNAQAKGITISYKPQCDQSLIIFANKSQIKHALTNLLAECISRASMSTQICVTIEKSNNKAILKAKIISQEIPKYILKDIFEKQAHGSAKFSKIGSSIRLYLTKKIIDSHNGEIIAHSFNSNIIFGFKLNCI